MNISLNTHLGGLFDIDPHKAAKYLWFAVFVAAVVLFASHAFATGGGNAMQELNQWIEDELHGSVGTTVALVAFFVGLVASIATRQFMPIVWGIGIGLVLGIFLNIVVNASGVGLPLTHAVSMTL